MKRQACRCRSFDVTWGDLVFRQSNTVFVHALSVECYSFEAMKK